MKVLGTVLAHLCLAAVLIIVAMSIGVARDNGQWENADPFLRAWFESLRQPDQPAISCCGNSDAYYADVYEVRDGKVYATITDNRGNPVPVGTVIEIPPHKVNRDPNITPHTILFLSPNQHVFCFIPSSGV